MKIRESNRLMFVAYILVGVPVVFYFLQFKFNFFPAFSKHPSDWATFGDYVQGLSGTGLSIATLMATIYIAMTIREYEKKKFVNDLRVSEYSRIKQFLMLSPVIFQIKERSEKMKHWDTVRLELENFKTFNKTLFPLVMNKNYNDLMDHVDSIRKVIDSNIRYDKDDKNAPLFEGLDRFLETGYLVNDEFQHYIINQL